MEAFGGGAKNTIAKSIPFSDALPVLAATAKSGSTQQKLFLTRVLVTISDPQSMALRLALSKDDNASVRKFALESLPRLTSAGLDQNVAARVREALGSKDPDEVLAVLPLLMSDSDRKAPFPPEFTSTLFSPHEQVRKLARKVVSTAGPDDSKRFMNETLVVLADESRKDQHVEAIRSLAALGPSAKPAVEKLWPVVKSDDQSLSIAAMSALRRILDKAEYSKLFVESFGDRLGISLPRRGESWTLPSDPQKLQEYKAIERALAEEQKQTFP
jgi:hypothetical protein